MQSAKAPKALTALVTLLVMAAGFVVMYVLSRLSNAGPPMDDIVIGWASIVGWAVVLTLLKFFVFKMARLVSDPVADFNWSVFVLFATLALFMIIVTQTTWID